ncbi:MAG: hypothetical protein AAGH15_05625 [Myxococcota bacterium]
MGLAAFLLLIAVCAALLVPKRWFRDAVADDAQTGGIEGELNPPDTLPPAPLDAQRVTLDADFAFELPGAEDVRVFFVEVTDGNYSVVAFRREGEEFRQMEPLHHPTGFEAPTLSGSPLRLGMVERRLRVPFVFGTEGASLVFEPAPEVVAGPSEILLPAEPATAEP